MGESGEQDEGPAMSRRALVLLTLALLVTLAGGVAILGLRRDDGPAVTDTASGCRVHALAFTVTDDEDEFAEQQAFERDVNELPAPGFYDRELDLVPTLHAASHSYVVVFTRPGLSGDGVELLRAMERRAVGTKAPVIVAQRDQDDAVVAIARGYELACEEGGGVQAAEVNRFAAQLYASVADPADAAGPAGSGPAPTTPSDAPSPVDQ